MPAYSTQLFLEKLEQHTTQLLQLAQSEWQTIAHEKFALKPADGGWSANECLQHLNSYGKYYYPAIRKAIGNAKTSSPQTVYKAGWLGNYFAKLMTPATSDTPMKKMKAPKNHRPDIILDSNVVIGEFMEQQKELLQLLQHAKSINMEKVRIPISISRWIQLQLGDTFHFLVMHNLRHALQARRALGFSQSKNVFTTAMASAKV